MNANFTSVDIASSLNTLTKFTQKYEFTILVKNVIPYHKKEETKFT